jgi:23S rRNA (cytosine1962-C5)-methyltransferase
MQNFSLLSIQDGEDKESILKNRIRKNYKHLKKFAARTETNAFRIYDRDIKEYPLAIDYYDKRFCVHYFSSGKDEEEIPKDKVAACQEALLSLFNISEDAIFWRSRIKRKKLEQYEKLGQDKDRFAVFEHGVKFWVNLTDYLDTGLFLDHRQTRQLVALNTQGKSLLNLFAYTCSFSLHAAYKGAKSTKSVDLSNTYLAWGKENFLLNGIDLKNHTFLRADCLKYLKEETEIFDRIVLDPPTISRSKKMETLFDIQRDHKELIEACLNRLAPEGVLYFSTNCRTFKMDPSLFKTCVIQDITKQTLPPDFRNVKIHYCWTLKPKTVYD